MPLNPGEILIHNGNYMQFTVPPVGQGMGLVPRNFAVHPFGSLPYAAPSAIQKIPRSEWSARIKDRTDSKSLISDIRNVGIGGVSPIPSVDQGNRGYCWAHSTTSSAILARAKDNQPYVALSAYAIACIIKNYRDEGGWNGESVKFLADRGCPSGEFWPQQSTSRSNDNPQTWANAALHKCTEWDDIPEGDFDLQMTYLILGIVGPLDLNWWSHSITSVDPIDGATTRNQVRMESGKLASLQEFDDIWETDVGGGYGVRIWNSWSDSWSNNGMGVLVESKARNNGAIALRSLKAATV